MGTIPRYFHRVGPVETEPRPGGADGKSTVRINGEEVDVERLGLAPERSLQRCLRCDRILATESAPEFPLPVGSDYRSLRACPGGVGVETLSYAEE